VCEPAVGPISFKNKATLEMIRNFDPDNKLALRTECLEISGKVDTATAELKCPNETASGKFNFCFNHDMMRYQNAVITDFFACVKKTTKFPLSMAGLFELYSLESAFKPHYSYAGGVGMGQLTGIFVDDINQKHRGFEILDAVAKSSEPECDIAKNLAAKDTANPKRLINHKDPRKSTRCDFVQYGEGLERNVLYTLVGLANSWDKDISTAMKTYNTTHEGNPDLERAQELALMNSYGAGGRAAARAAVKRFAKLPPLEFINAMNAPARTKRGNLTSYLNKINKRQIDLGKDMQSDVAAEFQIRGAKACVR
jgi:hypothetical protein